MTRPLIHWLSRTLVLALFSTFLPNGLSANSLELKVSGNKIVTVIGNCPIFFKGVNLPSLEWKDTSDGPVLTSAQTMAGTWGANIVRMPVNQDRWLGTACGTNPATYQAQYDGVINWCLANNVYVMLDLHWSDTGVAGGGNVCSGGQHDMPDNNSTAFWTSVATRYANNNAVLFDLYNEPKGIGSWTLWRNGGGGMTDGGYTTPGMQSLLNTVRATGAKNIVIAGGLNWAFDLTGVPANALTDATGNGVVYATHIYPWKAGPCDQASGCFDAAVPAAVHNTYPVMVTEFGQDNNANGVPNNSWAQSVMTWSKANTNGYIAWCLHDAASPCLITSFAGYTPSSWFGTTVKADMLATSAGGCVGTPTFTSTRTSTFTSTRTATPTPTLTATPSRTSTFSVTTTRTSTATVTNASSPTSTYTPSSTATPTSSRTVTGTPTRTSSASPTPTSTLSSTSSSSATPTSTRTISVTASSSATPTSTRSVTPSRTATSSNTVGVPSSTSTFTVTPIVTFTSTDTASPSATGTCTLTASSSATQSNTPGPSFTSTSTVTPTRTATATRSASPSATGTCTLTASSSATQSNTPGPSFTATPTQTTGSSSPTDTPTSTPTASSSATATSSSTATLSGTPTPTATRTVTALPSNTRSPTATFGFAPSTDTPTFSATSTATPTFTDTATFTSTETPSGPTPIVPAPVINSIQAAQVTSSGGETVTISGHGFMPSGLTPTVFVDGVAVALLSQADDTLTFAAPAHGASIVKVEAVISGAHSNQVDLKYVDPNAPVEILALVAVPNPGPAFLTVNLGGPATSLELVLYTKAMTVVDRFTAPGAAGGWVRVPLPAAWQDLANGTYYVVAVAKQGQKTTPRRIAKFFVLR